MRIVKMPPNLLTLHLIVIAIAWNQCRCQEFESPGTEPYEIPPALEPRTVGDTSDRISQLRAQLEASEMVAQIHGTMQQLSETARLRHQLQNAIRADHYARPDFGPAAPSVVDPSAVDNYEEQPTTPASFFPKFDLIKFLLGQAERTGEAPDFPTPGDDRLGSVQNPTSTADDPLRDFIRSSLEGVIHLPGDSDMLQGLRPELIDSGFVNDLLDPNASAAGPMSKQQLRESLELVAVTEDTRFQLGGNVIAWHALQSAVTPGVHALVGITDNGTVQLVLEQNGTYREVHQIRVDGPVMASLTFAEWSDKQLNGYVVVAVPGELLFISVGHDMSEMRIVWRWTLLSRVTALLHFHIDGSDALLLGNAVSGANDTELHSADVYHFDVRSQHTWLAQKIPLQEELHAVQFMELGREYVLVFAQNDTVEMMRYARNTDTAKRFVHFKTVESPQVATIACFQIGGLAYIAVGGLRPQILRYHRDEFYAQTILSTGWGLVEHIVAVPARTYRDDLIVLVQHRLQVEGGRPGPVLEALIWNGVAFQTAAVAVPCLLHGQQVQTGISCVLDEERDAGIEGASVIQRGTNISLLVPRVRAPSGLFTLNFRLTAVLNPTVGQTQYSHDDLLERLNAQTDVITDAETALLNADRDVTGDWNIDHLQVGALSVDDVQHLMFDHLSVGDAPWTADDAQVDVAAMLGELEATRKRLDELEAQIESPAVSVVSAGNGQFSTDSLRVLSRQPRAAAEEQQVRHYDRLHVRHLQAEFINGVPVNEFVFLSEDNSLNLGDSRVYLDSNDVHVSEAVVLAEPVLGDAGDADLSDGNVHIAGDVSIGEINGVNLDELFRNIVLVNVPNALDVVEVTGNVTFRDKLRINQLNELAFPDDFLWNLGTPNDLTTISGDKEFTYKVGTIEMDIAGLHNGIDTTDVITLSTDQTLHGLTTFADLQITESLNVTGRISGPNTDRLLANPSLMQTNFIQTDCQFHHLVVNGPIFAESVQGVNLDAMLNDVVYKSDERTLINSFKTFAQLQAAQVQLTTGLVNGIPMDTFMTLNTEQTLLVGSMSGNVIIPQLRIGGLIDFVNATELDAESIKLSGDQYTEAELIFDDHLDVDHIDTLTSLNDIALNTLIPTDQPILIDGNVGIDGTMITNLQLPSGQLLGLGVLNGQDLRALDQTRLSRTRAQPVLAPYFVRNLRITGDLEARNVNGRPVPELQRHLQNAQSVPQYLAAASTRLDRMIVDGGVQLMRVNGHDFGVIMDNVVWLDRANRIESILRFVNNLKVAGPLMCVDLNQMPFDDFVAGMVRKDGLNDLQFTEVQTFAQAPIGLTTIDAQRIGNIEVRSILTRSTVQINNLTVYGNVLVDSLNIAGTLNGTDFNEIADLYVFDELNEAHVMRHPHVVFGTDVAIAELWMHQTSPNVSAILASIVPRNAQHFTLTGRKTFTGRVSMERDLLVDHHNGIVLPAAMDAMIRNENGTTATVAGDVLFESRLSASFMAVEANITAATVMQCDWTDWLRNGIRIDVPWQRTERLDFSAGAWRSENVQVTYLNEVAMAGLITLNSEQTFNGTTQFSNILTNGDVQVGGLVNGLDLRQERDNTVTINGNQTISAPTNFQTIRILNSLQTIGTVNGLDLTQIVSLDEPNISLTGSFSFAAIEANQLHTDQLVSGIDFTRWQQNTLLRNSAEPQTVTGNWTIEQLLVANVDGPSGRLNGQPIEHLADRMRQHSGNMLTATADANQRDGVGSVCREVQTLVDRSQQMKYALAHFEELLRIRPEGAPINSVHVFEWRTADFLLLNAGCVTTVFKWNPETSKFANVGDLETGAIERWVMLSNAQKELHWATSSGVIALNCSHAGLNVWNFRGSKLMLVRNVGAAGELRLMETFQAPVETFYALHQTSNSVFEFDLSGSSVEEWKLPAGDMQPSSFVFLPGQINFGLALSDGARLCRLSSAGVAIKSRAKRFFFNNKEVPDSWQPPATKRMRAAKRERMETDGRPPWTVFGGREQKNVSDVPEAKLKMFRADSLGMMKRCNISWPKCKLGWFDDSAPLRLAPLWPTTKVAGNSGDVGAVHTVDSLAKSRIPLMPNDEYSAEEVVMAMPPGLDDYVVVNSTLDSKVDGKPQADVVAAARNQSANGTDTLTASRIDTFGRIEQKAKKLADQAFENMFGKPQHPNDYERMSNESETTGLQAVKLMANNSSDTAMPEDSMTTIAPMAEPEAEVTQTSTTEGLNENGSPVPEDSMTTIAPLLEPEAEVTQTSMSDVSIEDSLTTIAPLMEPEQEVIQPTTIDTIISEITTVAPPQHIKSTSNSTEFRSDTFGHIESKTKPIMDNIMENQFGPPNDPNEGDDADDADNDDDDDDVSATQSDNNTNIGASLFSVPQELQFADYQSSRNQQNRPSAYEQSATNRDAPQVGGILDVLKNVNIAVHEGQEIMARLRDDYSHMHASDASDEAPSHDHNNNNAGHEVHQPHHSNVADASTGTDGDGNVGAASAAPLEETDYDESSGEHEIGVPVQIVGGVATTENAYLPGRRDGSELVALDVGTNYRRLLVGVSEWSDDTVKGHQDRIRIYEDVLDGRVFQTINCHRPRSLATLRMGIDTALVFVERDAEVRVLVYRGIEGFVAFASFTLPQPVLRVHAAVLSDRDERACVRHVLAVTMAKEVRLLAAVGAGYCGMSAALECP